MHEEQEIKNALKVSRMQNNNNTSDQSVQEDDLIYYDHSISMLERTALRVYPIVKEVQARMVKQKGDQE